MDRLAATRLAIPCGNITDAPDVDFRNPNPSNDRITHAMATKLRRDCEAEESRIRSENAYLMKKLQVHGTQEERLRNRANLVPVEDPKPFEEQASNIGARRKEAQRILEANETLMFTMATLPPTVRNDRIRESVRKHNDLVKRISKFKPTPRYAGEELLVSPAAIRERHNNEQLRRNQAQQSPRDGRGSSAHGSDDASNQSGSVQKLPKIGWSHVSPHDVRTYRRQTDRAVRSVFLRNEKEVLQEAHDVPKNSNVSARRLTWSELGLQAMVPVPPSPRR
jgi:hypothetical protein